jgi:hypothetical protein
MKFLTGGARSNALACGRGRKPCGGSDANDRGGQIGRYVDRFEKLRASGETIIIDGLCASACTIVLGTIPYDRICVTPNANLAFHAAWDFGARGRAIPNPAATSDLFSMYPARVRRWTASRGGLTPRMIFLRGRQLTAMYRPCYLDAQVAVTRKRLNFAKGSETVGANVGSAKARGAAGAKALGHSSR